MVLSKESGSEPMSLVQLFVPTEVAHDAVAELGELGDVQFKDVRRIPGVLWIFLTSSQLNPTVSPFQRSFVGEIRRFEEMARIIGFFMTEIKKEKDPIYICPLHEMLPIDPRVARNSDEDELKSYEKRLSQLNENYKTLNKSVAELIEARHVLRETAVSFDQESGNIGGIRSDRIHVFITGRVSSSGSSFLF